MKKLISLLLIPIFFSSAFAALPSKSVDHVVTNTLSVGTSTIANSKAVVDMVSTTKGLLPPRLTTAQKNAISSPPEGLLGFDTDLNSPVWYTGAAWLTGASLTGTETLINKSLTLPIISSISNTGTLTLPTSTDTLVGRATADTLTNKDLDGGTASNSKRITIPKDTKANLDALTRKQGTVVYASDEDILYVDNGVALVEIGSGGGGGVAATAWASYSPVLNSTTGVSANTSLWRRVGDTMSIMGIVTFNSTGAAATMTVDLPSGYTMDTSKLPSGGGSANDTRELLGSASFWNQGVAPEDIVPIYEDSNSFRFNDTGGGAFSSSEPSTGDAVKFMVHVPISGWAVTEAETDILSKSTTYTATVDDDVILATTTSSWTLTLFTAVDNAGKKLIIKKVSSDTNLLIIDPNSTETIDGSSTNLTLSGQYDWVELTSNDSNWIITGGNITNARIAGEAYIAATTNCLWPRSSSTVGAFTADADCPAPTIVRSKIGAWSTGDTDLPKITVNSLPEGTYKAYFSVYPLNNTSGSAAMAINDGTTTCEAVGVNQFTSGRVGQDVECTFSYSAFGDRAFSIYGANSDGSALHLTNSITTPRTSLKFILEYMGRP